MNWTWLDQKGCSQEHLPTTYRDILWYTGRPTKYLDYPRFQTWKISPNLRHSQHDFPTWSKDREVQFLHISWQGHRLTPVRSLGTALNLVALEDENDAKMMHFLWKLIPKTVFDPSGPSQRMATVKSPSSKKPRDLQSEGKSLPKPNSLANLVGMSNTIVVWK